MLDQILYKQSLRWGFLCKITTRKHSQEKGSKLATGKVIKDVDFW